MYHFPILFYFTLNILFHMETDTRYSVNFLYALPAGIGTNYGLNFCIETACRYYLSFPIYLWWPE